MDTEYSFIGRMLTDDRMLKKTFDELGGETYVREKYPLVYEGVMAAREAQSSHAGSLDLVGLPICATMVDSSGRTVSADNGLENYAYIAYAYYTAEDQIFHICPVISFKQPVHAELKVTVYNAKNESYATGNKD